MFCCRNSTNGALHRLAIAAMAACTVAAAGELSAADATWKTGDLFKRELTQPVGVTWANLELRQAVESLSTSRRVAVVLDRRVDPNRKIELSFDDVPLAEAWQRIASRIGTGTTILGSVVYLGPAKTAERLRTVLALRKEDVAKAPAASRLRWTQLKPWKWEMLSAPRDLLAEACRESGVTVDNLSQIPADLWAAGDLPPLALPERLTLLLAQFDLTYETAANGLSIHLVPLAEHPQIQRTYPVSTAPQQTIDNLQATGALSGANVSVQGKTLVVRGTQEEHDLVGDTLAGRTAKTTTVKEGRKVYSLNVPVEKPVSKLLSELAAKLNWDLQIDRKAITAAGLSMDKLVTVEVKDVTEDELLRAILEPAGFTFRHRGNVVEVKPK
jgi:hypothetical protein